MAAAITRPLAQRRSRPATPRAALDPAWTRWTLTAVALGFLGFFLLLPLAAVFAEALDHGVGAYFAAFRDSDALAAIRG